MDGMDRGYMMAYSSYEIPYFWAYVGPPDMPEPGFYEDPMSLHPYGIKWEKMWRIVGLNLYGESASVSNLKSSGEAKQANVLLLLDVFQESAGIKPNEELALLIRGHGHGDEQNVNGNDEHIQQLYIPRAKCIKVTRISPDEWEDDDPLDAILTFCADFQSVRYMDSEAEADAWDKQIEEDANSGRLDALAEEAMSDFRAGRYTEL